LPNLVLRRKAMFKKTILITAVSASCLALFAQKGFAGNGESNWRLYRKLCEPKLFF